MKKIILALILVLIYGCESNSNSNPDPQFTGVVVDVNVYPSQSFLTSPITGIEFEDGRTVYFRGVYYGDKYSLQKGKCYVITYRKWDDRISRVEKCDSE